MVLQKDDICRTNLSQPGGLVKVTEVRDTTVDGRIVQFAWIEHIEDHPYGYKRGERGGYFVDNLIFVGRVVGDEKSIE